MGPPKWNSGPLPPPGCSARAHPSVRRCGETAGTVFDRPAYVPAASLTQGGGLAARAGGGGAAPSSMPT